MFLHLYIGGETAVDSTIGGAGPIDPSVESRSCGLRMFEVHRQVAPPLCGHEGAGIAGGAERRGEPVWLGLAGPCWDILPCPVCNGKLKPPSGRLELNYSTYPSSCPALSRGSRSPFVSVYFAWSSQHGNRPGGCRCGAPKHAPPQISHLASCPPLTLVHFAPVASPPRDPRPCARPSFIDCQCTPTSSITEHLSRRLSRAHVVLYSSGGSEANNSNRDTTSSRGRITVRSAVEGSSVATSAGLARAIVC